MTARLPRAGTRREFAPIRWTGNSLKMLDQTALPGRERWINCTTVDQVSRGIHEMRVRGAPAIGVTAAYGMAIAARTSRGRSGAAVLADLVRAGKRLIRSRPTAVNLAWAVERVLARTGRVSALSPAGIRAFVLKEARAIETEDLAANHAMGRIGASLFRPRTCILTHCNTGALATAGYGTALGVIRAAHALGKIRLVYVDETRPYLQGARLTAWELKRERIPFVLITDSMAGYFMQQGGIDAAIVGSDRIAANGDVANKIGTYSVARLAHAHGIPFYVAAPTSTVDLKTRTGAGIPIEERSAKEVVEIAGRRIAPTGIKAAHPAFDVTPSKFVSAIITEVGIARAPYGPSLRRLCRKAGATGRVE